jgi:hypothetical protein
MYDGYLYINIVTGIYLTAVPVIQLKCTECSEN